MLSIYKNNLIKIGSTSIRERSSFMSNIQTAEISNLSVLFQNSGKQLYNIRSLILNFYSKINMFDMKEAESNLDELYVLFSELDELVHMNIRDDLYQAVFKDPVIRSLLPAIHRSYSNFFSIHETNMAREILNNDNPWEMLESFPLYQRYVNLIKDQVENSADIKRLAFIGCGPLPITLILFSKLYGVYCIGIDKDPEAVELAKKCVKHFGLEKEINIVLGDETVLSRVEWDSVLIAGLTEPKTRIFRNLYSIIKKKKLELKKPISICYRNYTGMRQLLYWPVRSEHIRGFKKIKEIAPSNGVNNTLVFLECE
jgi:hypothetical protein